MNFAIGPKATWEAAGFDTAGWRHSVDGTKATAHIGFAEILIPELTGLTVYASPSAELDAVLSGPEWSTPGPV